MSSNLSQNTSVNDVTLHWSQNLFPSLDFETTGTDPLEARVVTVSALVQSPRDGIKFKYEAIVNPGVEIPKEASDVHGVTTERAQAEGIEPVEMLKNLLEFFERIQKHGLPLVIYNAMYDFPLAFAEFDRHGVEYDPAFKKIPILDPLVIDRTMDRYRKGKRKLGLVAAHYGVTLDDAHEAGADSLAAAQVMRAIVEKYPNLKKQSIEQMQEFQRQWNHDYSTRMNAYFVNNNIDMRFDTSRVWPGV